jgi:hypothetical protein
MTFHETLAALLGMIGRRVSVAIESPASGMVANLVGTLGRGHDITPVADGVDAPVLFGVGEEGGSGFVADPRVFVAAEWTADGELLRIEDSAGITILIELESDDT